MIKMSTFARNPYQTMPNGGSENFDPQGAKAGDKALDSDVLDSPRLSVDLRQDGADYLKTLQASTDTDTKGLDTLAQFDGGSGAPELVDFAQADQASEGEHCGDGEEKPEPVVKDGRVVRERSATGNDTVIAYDNEGTAHRFEDLKIESLPVDFSKIPEWRKEQLKERAGPLIEKYTEGKTPDGKPDGKISFNDVASMMKDVAGMEDLTEVEKARLWSDVRIALQKNDVDILDADEKPEMIDSWKGESDPWHAIITMDDGYHGNRLINMSAEDASKAILEHEDGTEPSSRSLMGEIRWQGAMFLLGINKGDINASEGTLRALRAYRENGTFQAYADAWKSEFVRTDVDRYGRPLSSGGPR